MKYISPTLKYMAFLKGNGIIRNAYYTEGQTQVDYFSRWQNGALLTSCTYSRSPHTHLQHSRHCSVSSHNQNVTSPLLVRPPRHAAHCRTGFVHLVPLFISRPDSRRGGSQEQIICRNSLDFSLDNRDIAARFPWRASNFTVFKNTQTGSGADPLSYLQGTGGFSPRGKATVTWGWPLTSI